MFALNKTLPAFALTLMLASGAANALPHPQFGDAAQIDLNNVTLGLEEGIKSAAAEIKLNIDSSPDVTVRTSR